MRRKKITSIPLNAKAFFAILSCIIFALFLSACGGGGEATTGGYTADTGAVAFSVEWPDQTDENSSVVPQGYSSSGVFKPAALDCGSTGIVNITAELYEASGEHIIDAGPWACSAHSAVMDSIPVGTNRTLNVYGKDGDGNVLYMGVTTGIDVVAGQTTSAGTVVLGTAMYMSIDYAYLQYRVFEDGVSDSYRGWLTLSKFGEPASMDDVLTDSEMVSITTFETSATDLFKNRIRLKNSSGQIIPILSIGRSAAPYFTGGWNSSTSSVDYAESLYEEFGFYMQFDTTSLPAGDYTYEVTTDKGDVLTKTVYFPGQTSLPIVPVETMIQQWVGDDLHLSWSDPGGSFDQFRVTMTDQNGNDLLYVRLPPSVTEITVPAQVIQKITDTLGPYVARWNMQARNYGSDNNQYARSISDRINFDWLEQPTPPAGKYDLLAYFPLSAGSMWSYWKYDDDNPDGWQDRDEYVEYSGNYKGLFNIRRYEQDPISGDTEFANYFNFDGQYIYVHGETEYYELDPDYGSTYFSPSITVDRFLGVGETTTSSVTRVAPDGSETAFSISFELLEVTTCYYNDAPYECLRVKETSVGKDGTDITEVYWALGLGEVESVEIQDPGDPTPDTRYLTNATVQPY